MITFAENGLYWHLDHIGVHERTYTAIKSLGAGAPPLYYVTMPRGLIRRLVDTARGKGGAPGDSSFWGLEPDAFGEAEDDLADSFAIDVRSWTPRKMAALRCHRTQMGARNPMSWLDDDDARRWLGIEYFRRSPLDSTVARSLLEAMADPVTSS